MKLKLQFLLALLIAGTYRLWQEFKSIRAAMKTEAHVSPDLAAKRLEVCQSCPIYNRRLKTCGSPLDYKTWDGGPMGCFCFMPVKATTACNCWLADNSLGAAGWARELNSFPLW